MSSNSQVLFLVSGLPMSKSKGFFISDSIFFLQHLHLTLLYFLSLSWHIPFVYAYCPLFLLDPFNISILVILKSLLVATPGSSLSLVLLITLSFDNFFFSCNLLDMSRRTGRLRWKWLMLENGHTCSIRSLACVGWQKVEVESVSQEGAGFRYCCCYGCC